MTSCQLRFFSDASQLAYGALSYLQLINDRGDLHFSFAIGKSRLTPLKPVPILRMESSAAVLSTRLDRLIRDEIRYPINSSVFCTDSTCVLRYVENDKKRYETLVANRVLAISEQSLPSQWRYVDTRLNPADDASRGISAGDIVQSTHWIKGPDFPWHDEAAWPQCPATMNEDQGKDYNLDVNRAPFVSLASVTATPIESMFERFSNWRKLKKFEGWMLRSKNNLRNAVVKRKQGGHSPPQSGKKMRPLDVEELKSAKRAIIEVVQIGSFPDEWLSLKETKKVKKASHVIKLDPVLIEVLVCWWPLTKLPAPRRDEASCHTTQRSPYLQTHCALSSQHQWPFWTGAHSFLH